MLACDFLVRAPPPPSLGCARIQVAAGRRGSVLADSIGVVALWGAGDTQRLGAYGITGKGSRAMPDGAPRVGAVCDVLADVVGLGRDPIGAWRVAITIDVVPVPFAHKKSSALSRARSEHEGVEPILVNPAHTSLTGLEFAGGYGLSSRPASAVIIGRRGVGRRGEVCWHEDRSGCSCARAPHGLSGRLATRARPVPGPPARDCPGRLWPNRRRFGKRLRTECLLGQRFSRDGGPLLARPGSRRPVVVPGFDSLVQVEHAVLPAPVGEVATVRRTV